MGEQRISLNQTLAASKSLVGEFWTARRSGLSVEVEWLSASIVVRAIEPVHAVTLSGGVSPLFDIHRLGRCRSVLLPLFMEVHTVRFPASFVPVPSSGQVLAIDTVNRALYQHLLLQNVVHICREEESQKTAFSRAYIGYLEKVSPVFGQLAGEGINRFIAHTLMPGRLKGAEKFENDFLKVRTALSENIDETLLMEQYKALLLARKNLLDLME